MKIQLRNVFLAAGIGVVVNGTGALAGVEETVALADLPAPVMEVAKAHLAELKLAIDAPGPVDDGSVIDDNIVILYEELGEVRLISANTETEEDGSFVYEIQGVVADGRRVEIDIDPSGNVLEIEVEFKIDDVPGAVLKSLEARMPGFTPEFIEASHSRSMQVVGYEFVGTLGENAIDIEVSADGRRIEVADQ
ncbi:MAG: hypothetical protein AAFX81_06930 [Pseudomonadota bacterium]